MNLVCASNGPGTCAQTAARGVLHALGGTLLLALSAARPAAAQAWVPGQGHGAVAVAFGTLSVRDHLSYSGDTLRPGDLDDQLMFLSADYGLTDRLAVSLSIPFVNKRYRGNRPHNPALLADPSLHDLPFIDDGKFHGSWADFSLKLRYHFQFEQWSLTPHVAASVPSHDYPYFAQAAVGTQQSTFSLGVEAGRTLEPPWQNCYIQLGYDYVFVEQERGINVDRSMLNLEFGYLIRTGVVVKLLATGQKSHGGLDFPRDFTSFRDDQWLHHDQIQRSDYLNAGFGVDYALNAQWGLSAAFGTTLWGENTYKIRQALTLGVSRSF